MSIVLKKIKWPAILLLGVMAIIFYPRFEAYLVRLPFEPEGWAVESDGSYPNRLRMVDDLMDHHLQIGMSFDSIVQLLGQPEYWTDRNEPGKQYFLVEEHYSGLIGIDPDYWDLILVHLDDNKRLTGFERVRL